VANPILSAKDESAQSLSDWLARPESANFTYQAEPPRPISE
jgi:hypothetical protein